MMRTAHNCRAPRGIAIVGAGPARVCEQSLPVRLLVILGAAPPLEKHTIYAAHPQGFAGQMRPHAAVRLLANPAAAHLADTGLLQLAPAPHLHQPPRQRRTVPRHARRLRQRPAASWMTALQNDPLFARWFAHAYAGVDPD